MNLFWLLSSLLFLLLIQNGESCGPLTHELIAHRARMWFKEPEYAEYARIIAENEGAFQNGVNFPDWGYNCLLKYENEHIPDGSETSHWSPFQTAAIDYLALNYPRPWNKTAERFVAFVFGVVSHGVADILWHDLARVNPIHQGLIQAMAWSSFKGSYATAHTEADVGGEFVSAYMTRNASFINDNWFVPTKDLVEIFKPLGFFFIEEEIRTCNQQLYGALLAITKLPAEILYPEFSVRSPFLVENLDEWWLGGLDDMALWTQRCWKETVRSILDGTDYDMSCIVQSGIDFVEPWEWPPFVPDPKPHPPNKTLDHHEQKIHMMKQIMEIGEQYGPKIHVKSVALDGGLSLTYKIGEYKEDIKNLMRETERKRKLPQKEKAKASSCPNQTSTKRAVSFFTPHASSLLGSSMTSGDYNKDGVIDLVLGAPGFSSRPGLAQEGAIYIIPYRNVSQPFEERDVEKESITTIYGNNEGAKFGKALTTLDFNLDGYDDLVVSSPSSESSDLSYTGQVHVYFGGPKGINSKKSSIKIIPFSNWTLIGTSLQTGDLNGDGNPDLLIGNPFATKEDQVSYRFGTRETGQLWVLLSSKSRTDGQTIREWNADWIETGEKNFEWFGHSSEVVHLSNGMRLLLIGSPGYVPHKVDKEFPTGMIRAYDFSYWQGKNDQPYLLWEISGSNTTENFHEKFGWSFATGKPEGKNTEAVLMISSPTQNANNLLQAGSIMAVRIEGLEGSYTTDTITPLLKINGASQELSRFGWSLGFSDFNGDGIDDFYATQPWHYNKLFSDLNDGAVYMWLGGPDFTSRGSSDSFGNFCIAPLSNKALYGRTSMAVDLDLDGKGDMILAGPRDGSKTERGGTVFVSFDFK